MKDQLDKLNWMAKLSQFGKGMTTDLIRLMGNFFCEQIWGRTDPANTKHPANILDISRKFLDWGGTTYTR